MDDRTMTRNPIRRQRHETKSWMPKLPARGPKHGHGVDDPTTASMTLGRRIAKYVPRTRHEISDGIMTLQEETKEPTTVDHTGAPALRLGARPFKVNLHAHVRQSTHESHPTCFVITQKVLQLGQGRVEIGQMQVVTSGRYRLQYPEF